jgi:hypothetical protein
MQCVVAAMQMAHVMMVDVETSTGMHKVQWDAKKFTWQRKKM